MPVITLKTAGDRVAAARFLQIGAMGEVVSGPFKGDVLLKLQVAIANLTNPTELDVNYDYVEVRPLEAGTLVQLHYATPLVEAEVKRLLKDEVSGPFYNTKIQAIKYHRLATGFGLKESKEYVEDVYNRMVQAGVFSKALPPKNDLPF